MYVCPGWRIASLGGDLEEGDDVCMYVCMHVCVRVCMYACMNVSKLHLKNSDAFQISRSSHMYVVYARIHPHVYI